jgi:hypothetical protein
MTEPDDSDGGRSGDRLDESSRFGDLASELTDESGVEASEDDGPGREDEVSDGSDNSADRTSESDVETDGWEWVGDSESNDAADQSSEGSASDVPKRSKESDRLWHDTQEEDPSGGDPAGSEPRGDEPVDHGVAESEVTDADSKGDEPVDPAPSGDEPPVRDDAVGRNATTRETGETAAEAGAGSSVSGQTGGSGTRVWDETPSTTEPSMSVETAASASFEGGSTRSAVTDPADGAGAEGSEPPLPSIMDLDPGTSVLIQSESRAERTRSGCRELLFSDREGADPYVLLIRYQPMDGEQLERVAADGHRTHVISVGYAQSVPPSVDEVVDVTQINNPNDITRLGIVVSRITQGWSTDDRGIRVCYDSLNVLLNYRDVKNVFRFLHVFLSTFDKTDATAHFHADPIEGDPQSINTLKPLFDEVVSIDSTGTYVE